MSSTYVIGDANKETFGKTEETLTLNAKNVLLHSCLLTHATL